MSSTKLFLFGLIIFSLLGTESNAQRFRKLPFGNNKTKTTVESTQLTQNAGPWLIMCASFAGENGSQQAFRLAKELRQIHRLNAYIYRHNRNIAQEVEGKGMGFEVVKVAGQERLTRTTMELAAGDSVEEIAVLVGNFSSLEDSSAQQTLARIKAVHPSTMAEFDRDPENINRGPLKAAFLMPNPMLPEEYFQARNFDKTVLKWKANRTKYSLLKNPGSYSVRVATFDGESSFQLDEIQQTKARDSFLKKNRKAVTESKLINAAKKATVLTAALRKQGIEAYEFHDRHESYVCVGDYNWISKEDASGNRHNNPDMVATIKKFKGEMLKDRNAQSAMRTYKLPDKLVKAGIACDVQPVPVLIPKAPTSHTAGRKLFGLKR